MLRYIPNRCIDYKIGYMLSVKIQPPIKLVRLYRDITVLHSGFDLPTVALRDKQRCIEVSFYACLSTCTKLILPGF